MEHSLERSGFHSEQPCGMRATTIAGQPNPAQISRRELDPAILCRPREDFLLRHRV
jgi:hypothetical protein